MRSRHYLTLMLQFWVLPLSGCAALMMDGDFIPDWDTYGAPNQASLVDQENPRRPNRRAQRRAPAQSDYYNRGRNYDEEDLAYAAPAREYPSYAAEEYAPRRDVHLGMGMQDVIGSWGQPGQVEVAGDPSLGNQRWVFYSGVSSRWGLGSPKVIYFEEWRVAGWQNSGD